jgi:hypothetical protein
MSLVHECSWRDHVSLHAVLCPGETLEKLVKAIIGFRNKVLWKALHRPTHQRSESKPRDRIWRTQRHDLHCPSNLFQLNLQLANRRFVPSSWADANGRASRSLPASKDRLAACRRAVSAYEIDYKVIDGHRPSA